MLRAAKGAEAAIHCAALLGGASQDLDDFKAVNMVGTTNVLDAGEGPRHASGGRAEHRHLHQPDHRPRLRRGARSATNPPDDPYTVTKLAAFLEAHQRAAAGEDVLTCHPGAIFGPGLVVERALHRTSFNRVLLAGMRGKIKRYLAFPVTWVAGADVAKGSIAALDRGVAGERYLLIGQPEDTISTAAGINRACEIAGIDHRVEDLDYRTDPEALTAEFGPTLMAIAEAAAKDVRKPRTHDNLTTRRLGYAPDVLRRRTAAADPVAARTRPAVGTPSSRSPNRAARIMAIWPIGSSTRPSGWCSGRAPGSCRCPTWRRWPGCHGPPSTATSCPKKT